MTIAQEADCTYYCKPLDRFARQGLGIHWSGFALASNARHCPPPIKRGLEAQCHPHLLCLLSSFQPSLLLLMPFYFTQPSVELDEVEVVNDRGVDEALGSSLIRHVFVACDSTTAIKQRLEWRDLEDDRFEVSDLLRVVERRDDLT